MPTTSDLVAPIEGVYVLLCEHDTLYVGESNNINKRITYHERGYGSEWTKKYRPIKELFRICCTGGDFERRTLERAVTLVLMDVYGFDEVAGSYWNSTYARWVPDDLSDSDKMQEYMTMYQHYDELGLIIPMDE